MSDILERKLFGTDGVRAKAGEYPLTPDLVLKLAQAAADAFLARRDSSLDWPTVVIGKDTRQSCDMLESAMAAGLNSRGIDVRFAGVIPTPAVAFLTRELNAVFGVVISASHNPFYDNGIKFFGSDGYKLSDSFELEIEHRLLGKGDYSEPAFEGIGRNSVIENAAERYVGFVREGAGENNAELLSGLTIALDCANGASFRTSEAVLHSLGATVKSFHNRPSGMNINDACGCTYPAEIEKLVRDTGADVGVSHDGDADRVLLCDEMGSVLDGDEMMAMAALAMIEDGTLHDNTLVATVMSNIGLDEAIRKAGGKVLRAGVGDRYVMEMMKKGGYNFGGEQSGHFIFRDFSTTGDGIISALRLLRVIKQKSSHRLSELRKVLTHYPQVQRNVRVRAKPPVSDVGSINGKIRQIEDALGEQGRVLVRYSGTEPLLRVLIEGSDLAFIDEQADELVEIIQKEIGE